MKQHTRKPSTYVWTPPNVPPHLRKERKPLLRIVNDRNELYFINDSDETIDRLTASSGGFFTEDDGAVMVESSDIYRYADVQPGEAVKIEEYDGFYDLDLVLQVYIRVESRTLGCLEIVPPANKGGVNSGVLLWDSNEAGRYTTVTKCK